MDEKITSRQGSDRVKEDGHISSRWVERLIVTFILNGAYALWMPNMLSFGGRCHFGEMLAAAALPLAWNVYALVSFRGVEELLVGALAVVPASIMAVILYSCWSHPGGAKASSL